MKQKQELKKWEKPKLSIIDFAKTNETVLVWSDKSTQTNQYDQPPAKE